jgi:8-oxo-dGTP pyrophosphatase MutT (NUDIX family)
MRDAALREAQEEVGLEPEHAELLGELDDVPTFVTGYVITPVVAIIDPRRFDAHDRYPWRASAAEVTQIHELPLAGFFDKSALRIEERERDGVRFELYWYTIDGATVWGATARIVHQLVKVIRGEPIEPPPWQHQLGPLQGA